MTKLRENFRIVFMGTPQFAVRSLEVLHKAGYDITAVVTAPDKPAGRGLKLRPSAVKTYAVENNITVLQPASLKDPGFITELQHLQADLFVVVAFRMLPEAVWSLPGHGTVNVHASLLPQYRGAAPINWSVIHGESLTGVTTFLIDHEIDTGKILFRKEVPVEPDDTVGTLHDRLMEAGAILMLETADAIRQNKIQPIDQLSLIHPDRVLRKAPKIFKEDCRINWEKSKAQIFNLIRGLSPVPAAFTEIESADGKKLVLKIFKAVPDSENQTLKPGIIQARDRKRMFISASDGNIELLEIQIEGRSKMTVQDFLNGFKDPENWIAR